MNMDTGELVKKLNKEIYGRKQNLYTYEVHYGGGQFDEVWEESKSFYAFDWDDAVKKAKVIARGNQVLSLTQMG